MGDELFNVKKKKGRAVNIFMIHIMFDEKFILSNSWKVSKKHLPSPLSRNASNGV